MLSFFVSCRRRHTTWGFFTGVQTCAHPILVTGTSKQYVDTQFFPVDCVGTACVAYLNGVAIDHQTILGLLSLAGKNAVCGVELGQIRHGLQVGRLVDGNDLERIAQGRLVKGPQYTAAYAAITVDCQT